MIDTALSFLRDQLNGYFRASGESSTDSAAPDVVTFPVADKPGDALGFAMEHISVVLVNLMEENTLRPANLYAGPVVNGMRQRVQPEVHLNLQILFVSHFSHYDIALGRLSEVIAFFQNHRVFTPANSPSLSPEFDQLTVELVTLPFSELNEIWGALRTNYRPSVLYRVRMVVFRDRDSSPSPAISEVAINTAQTN